MEVLTAWSAPSRPPFTLAKIVQQMKKVHHFQLILFKEEENAPPRWGPHFYIFYWNHHIFVSQDPVQNIETLCQTLLGWFLAVCVQV